MKTLKMNEKNAEKSRGCTYKITRFSAANCPRVAPLVSYKKHYLGFYFIPGLEDYDQYQLRYEQFCRYISINFSTFFRFYLMFCKY